MVLFEVSVLDLVEVGLLLCFVGAKRIYAAISEVVIRSAVQVMGELHARIQLEDHSSNITELSAVRGRELKLKKLLRQANKLKLWTSICSRGTFRTALAPTI